MLKKSISFFLALPMVLFFAMPVPSGFASVSEIQNKKYMTIIEEEKILSKNTIYDTLPFLKSLISASYYVKYSFPDYLNGEWRDFGDGSICLSTNPYASKQYVYDDRFYIRLVKK